MAKLRSTHTPIPPTAAESRAFEAAGQNPLPLQGLAYIRSVWEDRRKALGLLDHDHTGDPPETTERPETWRTPCVCGRLTSRPVSVAEMSRAVEAAFHGMESYPKVDLTVPGPAGDPPFFCDPEFAGDGGDATALLNETGGEE